MTQTIIKDGQPVSVEVIESNVQQGSLLTPETANQVTTNVVQPVEENLSSAPKQAQEVVIEPVSEEIVPSPSQPVVVKDATPSSQTAKVLTKETVKEASIPASNQPSVDDVAAEVKQSQTLTPDTVKGEGLSDTLTSSVQDVSKSSQQAQLWTSEETSEETSPNVTQVDVEDVTQPTESAQVVTLEATAEEKIPEPQEPGIEDVENQHQNAGVLLTKESITEEEVPEAQESSVEDVENQPQKAFSVTKVTVTEEETAKESQIGIENVKSQPQKAAAFTKEPVTDGEVPKEEQAYIQNVESQPQKAVTFAKESVTKGEIPKESQADVENAECQPQKAVTFTKESVADGEIPEESKVSVQDVLTQPNQVIEPTDDSEPTPFAVESTKEKSLLVHGSIDESQVYDTALDTTLEASSEYSTPVEEMKEPFESIKPAAQTIKEEPLLEETEQPVANDLEKPQAGIFQTIEETIKVSKQTLEPDQPVLTQVTKSYFILPPLSKSPVSQTNETTAVTTTVQSLQLTPSTIFPTQLEPTSQSLHPDTVQISKTQESTTTTNVTNHVDVPESQSSIPPSSEQPEDSQSQYLQETIKQVELPQPFLPEPGPAPEYFNASQSLKLDIGRAVETHFGEPQKPATPQTPTKGLRLQCKIKALEEAQRDKGDIPVLGGIKVFPGLNVSEEKRSSTIEKTDNSATKTDHFEKNEIQSYSTIYQGSTIQSSTEPPKPYESVLHMPQEPAKPYEGVPYMPQEPYVPKFDTFKPVSFTPKPEPWQQEQQHSYSHVQHIETTNMRDTPVSGYQVSVPESETEEQRMTAQEKRTFFEQKIREAAQTGPIERPGYVQLYNPEEVEPEQLSTIKSTQAKKQMFEQKIQELQESQLPPLQHRADLTSPNVFRQTAERPLSVEPLGLQPGTPPELLFAPKFDARNLYEQSHEEKTTESRYEQQQIREEYEKQVQPPLIRPVVPPKPAVSPQPPVVYQTQYQPPPQANYRIPTPQYHPPPQSPQPTYQAPKIKQAILRSPQPQYQAPKPQYQALQQPGQAQPYQESRQESSYSYSTSNDGGIHQESRQESRQEYSTSYSQQVQNDFGFRRVEPPKPVASSQPPIIKPQPVAPVHFELPTESVPQFKPIPSVPAPKYQAPQPQQKPVSPRQVQPKVSGYYSDQEEILRSSQRSYYDQQQQQQNQYTSTHQKIVQHHHQQQTYNTAPVVREQQFQQPKPQQRPFKPAPAPAPKLVKPIPINAATGVKSTHVQPPHPSKVRISSHLSALVNFFCPLHDSF